MQRRRGDEIGGNGEQSDRGRNRRSPGADRGKESPRIGAERFNEADESLHRNPPGVGATMCP